METKMEVVMGVTKESCGFLEDKREEIVNDIKS